MCVWYVCVCGLCVCVCVWCVCVCVCGPAVLGLCPLHVTHPYRPASSPVRRPHGPDGGMLFLSHCVTPVAGLKRG